MTAISNMIHLDIATVGIEWLFLLGGVMFGSVVTWAIGRRLTRGR